MAATDQKLLLFLSLYLVFSPALRAQSADQIASRLVGKPLYLRGFPVADQMEYDGDGTLREKTGTFPFALSGIDVTAVAPHGKAMLIEGVRVALVHTASSTAVLERRRVSSTTQIFGSLRRGDKRKYRAEEEVRVLVHPDARGSYEQALARIFLIGESALVPEVPPYWHCFARTYFRDQPVAATAQSDVMRCVRTDNDGNPVSGVERAEAGQTPRLLSQLAPQFPARDADLNPAGTVEVHFIVRTDGQPVGFQIVQAVGGASMRQFCRRFPLRSLRRRCATVGRSRPSWT